MTKFYERFENDLYKVFERQKKSLFAKESHGGWVPGHRVDSVGFLGAQRVVDVFPNDDVSPIRKVKITHAARHVF